MINQNTCIHENYPIKEEQGERVSPLDDPALKIHGATGTTFDGDGFGAGVGSELVGIHERREDQVGYCSNCDKRLYSRPPEWDGQRFQGWLKNGPEHPTKHITTSRGRQTITLQDRYPGIPSPSWFLNNITRHQSDPEVVKWWEGYKKMHTDFQNQKHPNLGVQFDEITGRLKD